MPVENFRFLSPGVQIQEIDKSKLPDAPSEIGPVIIGRAEKGPAMVPVIIRDASEFRRVFGAPIAGGRSNDVWRDGNQVAPTYGAFAAEAYLNNNGPITFVRLLGEDSSNATTIGLAGWTATNAYGIFPTAIATGSSDAPGATTGVLGAVIYTTEDDVEILLKNRTSSISGSTGFVPADSANTFQHTLVIVSGGVGGEDVEVSVNFDKDSSRYIRKVLNTNPHFTNNSLYGSDRVRYWLGETFETHISETLGSVLSPGTGKKAYGVAALLTNGAKEHANRSYGAQKASTGWIISQDLNDVTGSYSAENMQKLFKFESLHVRGGWDNANLKISITDITAPVNPEVNPYGSFSVVVRDATDVDERPIILEQFNNCNLDPSSPNYIARRIGDQYYEWDEVDKRYKVFGTYSNLSSFIRVEMKDEVENGVASPELLPFGFFGPDKYLDITDFQAQETISNRFFTPIGTGSLPSSGATGYNTTGSIAYPTGSTLNDIDWTQGVTEFTASFLFPKLALRSNSVGFPVPGNAYFGVNTNGAYAVYDRGYGDYMLPLSSDAVSSDLESSFVFSLDELIQGTGSVVSTGTFDAAYVSGSRAAGNSISTTTGYTNGTSTFSGSYEAVLNAGFNQFTIGVDGGFDGLDITEPEPFANRLIVGTEPTNYEQFSLKKAIDTCRDTEVVQHNFIAVPGVSNTMITDYLLNMAAERQDTLALIDVENDYKPRFELLSSQITTNRISLPDVDNAFSSMKSRNLNTSYGAAYFPAVKVRDRNSGLDLFVPATVVAVGTYGYVDATSEPWFAPAGFNRGGLSSGVSGLTVTDVSLQLTKPMRDKLQRVNINPIAKFVSNGVVIYGQKTLLAEEKATDRVNVRRLLLETKRVISISSRNILFENNVRETWINFKSVVEPYLDGVKARFGLTSYRLILDETTTTPDLIDRNILYARVLLKPARAIEFIALDFEVFRTGASFDD